jgi:site-specific DNA-methyltransferase (cytosine-N4-specific)
MADTLFRDPPAGKMKGAGARTAMATAQTLLTEVDSLRPFSVGSLQDPRNLRRADSVWDFRGVDTKYATHGIYRYPAMMVAPVVRRLIDDYSPVKDGGRLLDPFCGSGSALVEAMLHGMASVGVDLNPLAVLLARVKTTPLDPDRIRREHQAIDTRFDEATFAAASVDLERPGFWYSKSAIDGLSRLRTAILKTEPKEFRRFFEAAFAETARYVSWTRQDEYKTYRLPEEKRRRWRPSVLGSFAEVVAHNTQKMSDFITRLPEGAPSATVVEGDVRDPATLPNGTFDLIITSPPYGDSRTTVAYGQYSSLSLRWLGYDRKAANRTDRESLGGRPIMDSASRPDSPTLDRHLTEIRAKDPVRSRDVLSFYVDLCAAFRLVARKLAPGGLACVVVGNRTVKGVRLETDVILSELFEHECGLRHLETIVRGIPNKLMPLRNSPSNVAGELGNTMANEYILVLDRPKA